MTSFWLCILYLPIPWKAPYVGVRGAYSPRTKIMEDFRVLLRQQWKYPMLTGPVICNFDFFMPIPKSTSKKKRKWMVNHVLRPTTTPDRGNLEKLYSDVLQGVVYENDSCVVGGHVNKWYGEIPRTVIQLIPYDESYYRSYGGPPDYMGNSLPPEIHQGSI